MRKRHVVTTPEPARPVIQDFDPFPALGLGLKDLREAKEIGQALRLAEVVEPLKLASDPDPEEWNRVRQEVHYTTEMDDSGTVTGEFNPVDEEFALECEMWEEAA